MTNCLLQVLSKFDNEFLMFNSQRHTVSESTATSFIPRQYSWDWDYRHEHERRK